ncbi:MULTISPECIES: hypothetical protein [unclassified Curtobacterium]|uniref:hypothetical protein n=1 Tax=unclassified Curtobacterium TaxID=257496 RepID=UPI0008DC8567|nr:MULTISPECIES: hypothetical protein [unclassified Curtobacterium]OIH99584.1 hypothetical protein BIU92_01455 [Curtobacterium sp. MCBA15_003]OII11489.1 hypothetical protein BIU97_06250 [Curtobacterium sp. MCBA15_009]OII30581.1 hypothetical protein BIU94_07440 [Curtobacterium sp. MMLR14_006]WIE64881.1 hypothetical protein DEI99_016860 [Curtobacterium sp. MCLR17_036]
MADPTGPTTGPTRKRIATGMTAVFVVLLVSMLALGTVMVLLQLVGVLVLDAALVSAAAAALAPWTFGVGGALGIWTLLLAYAHGWKSNE